MTPTQFGHSRSESDSVVGSEGPGRICPQVGPRSVSINWGFELPLNPFARHPTFLQLAAEFLGPREIHARLRAPEMKARLLAEAYAVGFYYRRTKHEREVLVDEAIATKNMPATQMAGTRRQPSRQVAQLEHGTPSVRLYLITS